MTVTAASGAALDKVIARVRQVLPDDAVISDHARLRTYECDGLEQPSGYTEPILHRRRAHKKSTERSIA